MHTVADIRRALALLRAQHAQQTPDAPLNLSQSVDGSSVSVSEWAFDFLRMHHRKRLHKGHGGPQQG